VTKTECYRCNQKICDLADSIYPEFQKTVSKNDSTTKHDGVFEIKQDEVKDYIHKYKPKILRNSKKVDTLGFDAINIGVSKGLTFDRVLLFPTQSMSNYLKTRDLKDLKDKAKLYIAITRARYSFAFILK
jgi:DNA helicase IV